MMPLLQSCAFEAGGRSSMKFVGYAASTSSGAAMNVVIPKPSGVIPGDLMVAFMSSQNGETWTPDTGWTEQYDQALTTGLGVMTKIAGASEGSSYTFPSTGNITGVGQIIAIRRGLYDALGSVVTLSGNGSLVIPTLTSAGGILLAAIASMSQASRTHSTPAGMTLTEQKFNGTTSMSVFYEIVPPGSTGTRTSTMGGGTGNNSGILVGAKSS